jgi:hypothetical protein
LESYRSQRVFVRCFITIPLHLLDHAGQTSDLHQWVIDEATCFQLFGLSVSLVVSATNSKEVGIRQTRFVTQF